MFYQPSKTDPCKSIDGFHHLQHSPVLMVQFLPTGWNLYKFISAFSTFTKISSRLSSNHSVSGGWYYCQCFSRWFQGVHGFIFIRAIFLHNVGLPTCRWLQHGSCCGKQTSGGQKNMEREIFKFLKNTCDKSCSCILTGCLFRPVEYKP